MSLLRMGCLVCIGKIIIHRWNPDLWGIVIDLVDLLIAWYLSLVERYEKLFGLRQNGLSVLIPPTEVIVGVEVSGDLSLILRGLILRTTTNQQLKFQFQCSFWDKYLYDWILNFWLEFLDWISRSTFSQNLPQKNFL